MKAFLFDENVPRRLSVVPSKPVLVVRDAVGASASDRDIWEFGRQNECVIISKDADFSDLALAGQPPPWVVHLRSET